MDSLLFRIFDIRFIERDNEWWKNTNKLQKIFEVLEKSGFENTFTHFGLDGGKHLNKISSYDRLFEESKKWKLSPYLIKGEVKNNQYKLGLSIKKYGLNLFLEISGPIVKNNTQQFVNQLITFGFLTHKEFKNVALLGSDFQITGKSIGAKVKSTPKLNQCFPIGSLVDFYSKTYIHELISAGKIFYKALRETELPSTVSREEMDDLIIIQWVNNYQSELNILEGINIQTKTINFILKDAKVLTSKLIERCTIKTAVNDNKEPSEKQIETVDNNSVQKESKENKSEIKLVEYQGVDFSEEVNLDELVVNQLQNGIYRSTMDNGPSDWLKGALLELPQKTAKKLIMSIQNALNNKSADVRVGALNLFDSFPERADREFLYKLATEHFDLFKGLRHQLDAPNTDRGHDFVRILATILKDKKGVELRRKMAMDINYGMSVLAITAKEDLIWLQTKANELFNSKIDAKGIRFGIVIFNMRKNAPELTILIKKLARSQPDFHNQMHNKILNHIRDEVLQRKLLSFLKPFDNAEPEPPGAGG